MTGTSASSAFTAGVAALVLQAHPSYSPTQVKGAIVGGANHVPLSRTGSLDAAHALSVTPARVNVGVLPSLVLMRMLERSGALGGAAGVNWEGISWEGITWESVTWEGVTWESVSWESVTWESVTWESVRVEAP